MRDLKKKNNKGIFTWFSSIRSTIIFCFGILIIVALFTFLMISLNYTEDTVLNNSKEYTVQLVEQVRSEIDSYISYMENISQMVMGDEDSDLIQYLFVAEKENNGFKGRVLNQFRTVMDTRSDILNIGAVADNGRCLLNDGEAVLNPYAELKDMVWYQDTMDANGASVVSSSHVQNAIQGSYQWVITLSKALVNPLTGKTEGIFFIDLNYSAINSLCEKISLGSKGYLFIVDKHKSIIYHPQQQLVLAGLKPEQLDRVLELRNGSFMTNEGDQSKLYTICSSSETGWTLSGVAYLSDLMRNKERTQIAYVLLALGLFVMALVLSILISGGITRPLTDLKEAMKEVEKGNFNNASFEASGNNEIAVLGNSFNIMTERIQQLMEENVQEQREKRKSELKALQSQINPHFLYNTLDSIIWMSESGKNDEVVLMTSSLAKLLRQSISNENEIVPIYQEIEYTRSYLTIQKMRYRDQLEFEIFVDEDILTKPIVKLVVQPLVENAIYHGIKYLDGKGMIWINGSRSEDKILISVSDNGVGMDETALEGLLERKKQETADSAKGKKSSNVGVYNVHNRLKLYYGEGYGLSYESAVGIGTTVFITIPFASQEAENGKE